MMTVVVAHAWSSTYRLRIASEPPSTKSPPMTMYEDPDRRIVVDGQRDEALNELGAEDHQQRER